LHRWWKKKRDIKTGAAILIKKESLLSHTRFLLHGLLKEALPRCSMGRNGVLLIKTGFLLFPYTYSNEIHPGQPLNGVHGKGLYGYVDGENRSVIPFTYDDARDFEEGMAVVGKKQT
jgi:hypothetical protein